MSADRLREAAKVLRERAEAANDLAPAPWSYEGAPNGQAPLIVSSDHQAVAETFDKPGLEVAAYIATMHPGVGLALADWLDNEGHILYDLARVSEETARQCAPAAHAIADLILGGAA